MPLLGGGGKEHLGWWATGVGYANIDSAELLRHLLHELFDRGLIGYIQRLSNYLGAVAVRESVLPPAFSFLASREHMASFAPSAANFSAAARAMPSLDAATMTLRFFSPRSTVVPFVYFFVSSRR